jgi:hypothetical protein
MKSGANYWRQKQITLTGKIQSIEIPEAQEFYQSQALFLEESTETEIQQQLWNWFQEKVQNLKVPNYVYAVGFLIKLSKFVTN